MNKIACGATRKAPMKTVPVFGGNGVNSRRNQVIIMRLPPKTGTVFKGAVMEDGTSSCD